MTPKTINIPTVATTETCNPLETVAKEDALRFVIQEFGDIQGEADASKFAHAMEWYKGAAGMIFAGLELSSSGEKGVEKTLPPYKEQFAKDPVALQESRWYQLYILAGNILSEQTGKVGTELFEAVLSDKLKNPYSKR